MRPDRPRAHTASTFIPSFEGTDRSVSSANNTSMITAALAVGVITAAGSGHAGCPRGIVGKPGQTRPHRLARPGSLSSKGRVSDRWSPHRPAPQAGSSPRNQHRISPDFWVLTTGSGMGHLSGAGGVVVVVKPRYRSKGQCTCGWVGKPRLLLSSAKVEAVIHAARHDCEPAFPLIQPDEAQFRQFAAERAQASRGPPPDSANSAHVANSQCCRLRARPASVP
ncbi:MAG: hypothetical protein QOC62_3894 [Mycobacterium sp.]|jgi:hypothetical protein|nr:hypothetical protein [Mycobacterium sp.]